MLSQNFDYIEENYSDKLISKVFGENHIEIKNFNNFKNGVRFGKISLNFKYDKKLILDFTSQQNFAFHNGIKNLKNFGAIIFILYSLIFKIDLNIIYFIPILFLIRYVITIFWYKKLITTILLIAITFLICNYFDLDNKIFLISFILLQSITESSYLMFLEQYFSFDEIRFGFAIEKKIISKIYDGYEKKIIEI